MNELIATQVSYEIMDAINEGSIFSLNERELLRQRVRHIVRQALDTACEPLQATETGD